MNSVLKLILDGEALDTAQIGRILGLGTEAVDRELAALRQQGVRVQMHAGSQDGVGSMKSQFKRADASGARFALVFGASELALGQVTVKALRDGQGAQSTRPLDQVDGWARTLQSQTLSDS